MCMTLYFTVDSVLSKKITPAISTIYELFIGLLSLDFMSILYVVNAVRVSSLLRTMCVPSADIVDGNLKSVMRIILALAAHFKPSANHRTASGNGRSLTRSSSSHNPLSTVALAQGAAAALASARHDASQPASATRIHRYVGCK